MTVPSLTIQRDQPSSYRSAGYLILGDPTYGLLGSRNLAATEFLVDCESGARDLSIKRGMGSSPLFLFQADVGTAEVTFDNSTRVFDPSANSDTVVGCPFFIGVAYGSSYDLFKGRVDQWKMAWPAYGADATTVASVNDGLAQLAQLPIADSFPAETTGQRINRIANLIGWPQSLRSIDTGATTMNAGGNSASAFAAAQLACDSELGQLYVAPDGTLTFRGRNSIATDTRSKTSQYTFTDSYQGIEVIPTNRSSVVNKVTVVYDETGASVTAQNNASVNSYGVQSISSPIQVQMANGNIATSYAEFLVTLYESPRVLFSSVTIRPARDPANLWAQVFSRALGDRITVVRTPKTGSPISQDCFIVGITHSCTASMNTQDWATTFTLMDATNWPTSAFSW